MGEIKDAQEAARAKGVQFHVVEAGSDNEIEPAFATLSQLRAGELVVVSSVLFSNNRPQLLALALRHSVPAIAAQRDFAVVGGLLSYGSSVTAAYHLKGIYIGRSSRAKSQQIFRSSSRAHSSSSST